MKMFRTKYDKREIVYSHHGNEIEEIIDRVITKDGKEEFQVVDKVYVPDKIQSYFESTDLNLIIQRFMDGDISALQRRSAAYFDAVGMPSTLAEAYAVAENGRTNFDRLPLSVRESYNFDFGQYLADIGSDHYLDVMTKAFGTNVPKAEDKKEEKKEGEKE